jgi:SAM-dependent methyltransferase
METYLQTVYNKKRTPYTDYPSKLVSYLVKSHQMAPGSRLLEPGCGRGEHLTLFKTHGLEVHGLDISSEAVSLSPDLPIKVANLEVEKAPYEDNYFDIIYSKSFLEHLRSPELFAKEAYRILKPGGLFLSLVPDWESQYKTFYDDFTHRSPFTLPGLQDFYLMNGFDGVSVKKFRQLPITWKLPVMNAVCAIISTLIPVRTQIKALRWSRELMLLAVGTKPLNK